MDRPIPEPAPTRETKARGPRAIVAALAALGTLATAAPALAQTPAEEPAPPAPAVPTAPASPATPAPVTDAAPAAPVVVMPKLLEPSAVRYPATALAEKYFVKASVVLVLSIDADGAITETKIETPAGHGFDEEATEAAKKLKFSAATRDGKPVPVRIKYRYDFTPPAPRLVVRVLGEGDEKPVTEALVSLTAPDGQSVALTKTPNGTWAFEAPEAAKVLVRAEAVGRDPNSARVELAYGEETTVTLRLARAALPVAPKPLDPKGEPPTLAPAAEPTAPAPPAGEEPIQEVSVRGEKPPREVTKRTLSREELRLLPGSNGDALASIQALTGVARPPPFSGQLIVRGSAPAETLVFVDGTPIPIAYHFGGLSSVLPTEALERLDFFPGNFSTAFGRGTAGVVDLALRDPNNQRPRGFAQLDLIDARLLAEGPLGNTGINFLAATRRSWLDAWLGPVLQKTGASVQTTPRYYDYQVMLQRKFGESTTARIALFGSDDGLQFTSASADAASANFQGAFRAKTGFFRLQGVVDTRLSEATRWKTTLAWGKDALDIGGSIFVTTNEVPLSLRSEVTQNVMRGLRANVGVDALYTPYDLSLQLPRNSPVDQQPTTTGEPTIVSKSSGSRTQFGAYAEAELTPWAGTRIVPGLRADRLSTASSWDVSPRINLRQRLGDSETALKAGFGVFHQPPTVLQTDPNFGQKGLSSTRALQSVVGVDHVVASSVKVSLDVFCKGLEGLVVNGKGNSGEGRAYGSELFVKYQGNAPFFGWVAYTLSHSIRRDSPDLPWQNYQYDQTHVLTVVGSYDLGRGYRLGGRFRLVSGNPYTSSIAGGYDASTGTYFRVDRSPAYADRFPPFHALDVRFDKTWAFQSWKLSAYVDVQNIYNHQSPESITYNYDYTQSTYMTSLPLLPSLGLRGEL